MTRIGDRAFLFAWQAIRSATQPGPEATSWQVAGVRWHRHRYSLTGPDHTMMIEVHRLDHSGGHAGWGVMVVAEHWWDAAHKPLRNTLWATHLFGPREQAIEWMDRQGKALDRNRDIPA